MHKYTVGIAGFTGYSGVELISILGRHPSVEPVLLEHRSDTSDKALPRGFQGPRRIPCTQEAVAEAKLDAVMLATHQGVSMELTPRMLAAGAKVIDLSGAFRLRTGFSKRSSPRELGRMRSLRGSHTQAVFP